MNSERVLSRSEIHERFAGQTVLLANSSYDSRGLHCAQVVGRCIGEQAKGKLLREANRLTLSAKLQTYEVPDSRGSKLTESESDYSRNDRMTIFLYRQRCHWPLLVLILTTAFFFGSGIRLLIDSYYVQAVLSLLLCTVFGSWAEKLLRRNLELAMRFYPEARQLEYNFWSPFGKRKFRASLAEFISAYARFDERNGRTDFGLKFHGTSHAMLLPLDTAVKTQDHYRMIQFLRQVAEELPSHQEKELKGFLVAYMSKMNLALEPEIFYPHSVPMDSRRKPRRRKTSTKLTVLRSNGSQFGDLAELLTA